MLKAMKIWKKQCVRSRNSSKLHLNLSSAVESRLIFSRNLLKKNKIRASYARTIPINKKNWSQRVAQSTKFGESTSKLSLNWMTSLRLFTGSERTLWTE